MFVKTHKSRLLIKQGLFTINSSYYQILYNSSVEFTKYTKKFEVTEF